MEEAVPNTVTGDVQWAVGAARSSTPASAGSASAAPAQPPAGAATNDEHLAAAWGYPTLPKGVLSYKDADVALLHHAKKLFEEQLQQLQEEERQLRAGIVPSADAPLVEQPTEPHTPCRRWIAVSATVQTRSACVTLRGARPARAMRATGAPEALAGGELAVVVHAPSRRVERHAEDGAPVAGGAGRVGGPSARVRAACRHAVFLASSR